MAQETSLKTVQVAKTSARMVQIAKYLDMSDSELEERVREELEANPALKDLQAESATVESPESPDDGGSPDEVEPSDSESRSEEVDPAPDEPDYPDETDYSDPDDEVPDSARNWMEQTAPSAQTLAEDLLSQFDASVFCSPALRPYVKELVYRMSDTGIIEESLDDLRSELKEAFAEADPPYREEDFMTAVAQLQGLEPPGVGAVGAGLDGMARSLSLQLERTMDDMERRGEEVPEALDDALMIVDDYFTQLHDQDLNVLLERSGLDEVRFAAALREIRKLHVYPVAREQTGPVVVQPDFAYDPETREVTYRGRQIGSLGLDDQFLAYGRRAEGKAVRTREDDDTIRFVKRYQAKASRFIDVVNTRTAAMVGIMRVIAARQSRFLESGYMNDIQPLTMQEVAEEARVDTSTVSRVVNRRYIELPGGNFPLRQFFVSGLTTESGEDVSKRVVMDCVADLVAAEDPACPLSDRRIVEILKGKGMPVALRTVNKYRALLGIPESRKRKRMKS